MSELGKLYAIADKFRKGTCPARLGERWCEGEADHPHFYHVTDNGIAWSTDDEGTIYDVHSPNDPSATSDD